MGNGDDSRGQARAKAHQAHHGARASPVVGGVCGWWQRPRAAVVDGCVAPLMYAGLLPAQVRGGVGRQRVKCLMGLTPRSDANRKEAAWARAVPALVKWLEGGRKRAPAKG